MSISDLLAEKGLSIDAIAERIGVDVSMLSDCVNGKAEPSPQLLAAIREACGDEAGAPVPAPEAEQTAGAPAAPAEEEAAAQPAREETAVQPAEEETAAQPAGEEVAAQPAEEEANAQPAEEEADAQPAVEEAAAPAEEETAAQPAEEEAAAQPAVEEAAAEAEAARLAAEEKAARKAAKKAAKKQKADEEAAQWVAEAIRALGDSVGLDDEDAVAAARDAYDSLTYDQEQLIPGDLVSLLISAEQMLEEASKTFPIEDCWITVKQVPYTGKKIEKPSVKVECGDVKLKEGEDYTFSYDKKIRDAGLYTLTVKGKGRFTGDVEVPFYVVPKTKALIKLLGGDKEAAVDWKCLKHIRGYQVEYSLDEDFSDSRKEKIKKPKDLEKLAGKLKAGKKYYVRVRVYAKVDKTKYYSDWSKVRTVKL